MADLNIETRKDYGLVSIMARKGVSAQQIGGALGTKAPVSPGWRSGGGGPPLVGTGFGTWLAYADGVSPFWADELRVSLEGLASVSDQSSGYVILRLTGAGARTVLQRGMAIDLHPNMFTAGSAATSVISHIGVIVWQVNDEPCYDVATFRSLAGSFRHWLDQAALAL